MKALDDLIFQIRGSAHIDRGNLIHHLCNIKEMITRPPKTLTLDTLQKYDVIYVETLGLGPHYLLIHKVTEKEVFGVVISSKNRIHVLHQIEKDRILKNSYITKLYMNFEIERCKDLFVRKFENIRETDLIFRKLKQYYKDTLNL